MATTASVARRIALFKLVLLGLAGAAAGAESLWRPSKGESVGAVRALIERRVPALAPLVELEISPRTLAAGGEHGSFRISTYQDEENTVKLRIRGDSGVSLASGLNWYFENIARISFSWTGSNPELHLPLRALAAPVERNRTSKWSYYYNVCTMSYSAAFWDWKRWEFELDWMALHGINMPLAFVGQEYVFSQMYYELGLTKEDLDAFFVGGAFYAWGRMGNIRHWGGPMTESYIERQFMMGKQIIKRMAEFGMTPALPAFAGHVPQALTRVFPDANVTRHVNWGGFPEESCCVRYLQPTDPLYKELAEKFIRKQTELFADVGGTWHIYQGDQFNEMDPYTEDPEFLRSVSAAMYDGMQNADADAVWLVQGWMFVYSKFWDEHPERLQAYLDGVPDDRAIILDLFADVIPGWSRRGGDRFFGKKFIYCQLHNFGGTQGLAGRLSLMMSGPYAARTNTSDMIGIGLTMEGIDQNSLVYHVMLDDAWRPEPEMLTNAVVRFVRSRYGVSDSSAETAWLIAKNTAFEMPPQSPGAAWWGVTQSLMALRPEWDLMHRGLNPTTLHYDAKEFAKAWPLIHHAGRKQRVRSTESWRFDAVDFSRQVLSNLFIELYEKAKDAFERQSAEEVEAVGTQMFSLIKDFDRLLSTNAHFMLGPRIAAARSWGQNEEESNLLEFNARNLVTLWGPNGNIDDYATRQWGGLVADYHMERWQRWIAYLLGLLDSGDEYDDDEFTDNLREEFCIPWQTAPRTFPTEPQGDVYAVVGELLRKYGYAVGLLDQEAA